MLKKQLVILFMTGCLSTVSLAASVSVSVSDQTGNPIQSAVVEAVSPTGALAKPATFVEIVDQVNKEFVPHITVVPVNTPIKFPNKDNIHHHVYSFSPAKPFELPLYEGTPTEPILFDKAGIVTLGCNIHDWMLGYIYVADSDKFAQTDAKGQATISQLPAGKYLIKVWHPNAHNAKEADSYPITLADDDKQQLAVQMTIKPAIRIRRTPSSRNSQY
ncbi:hypothetical protein [Beggiatoa leptomitoformis]|uniref:Methylamine utilization protein n=1 Tax=Beggiatoa leptomitoformis TaxID=288004 RepID=A0A2N9YHD9_9GAMM|nr:hypothetical protein [Beggiatoa leptomitoformis]ALG69416.2 hypothetical protein AL038_08910 [Beggiatoa leptomitoformis]AUI69948.1 hypothetical protein BLE401_15400 [Beggiatoa leptomitoformis]